MFAKHLLQKATHHFQQNVHNGSVTSKDLDFQIITHYGIPSTASVLAFDSIQCLLAIGTLDGRIKVIGGDNIEGLLIAPKQLPYKYLEFLQNQGYLVSISNDNEVQVWNLESRSIACCLQWESNITAFSVISSSHFMYVGDEYGLMSVLKYEADGGKLLQLPYQISANSLCEAAGLPPHNNQPIVGVLPQPCLSGNRVLIAYQNGVMVLWDVFEARVVAVRGDKDLQLKDGVADPKSEVDADFTNVEEKEISALCWASSDGSILAVGYIDGDIFLWNTSSAASTKGQEAGLSNRNVVKLQLSSAERRLPVIVLHWSVKNKSSNNTDGHLFIYGGDEMGSDEVLTVLSLEWLSGMETLKCVNRIDLELAGSFADMIFLPAAGTTGKNHKDLFVLTNPGQLHFYDDASLSMLISQQERRSAISAKEFPIVVPTADPYMTVSQLTSIGGNSSKSLSEIAAAVKIALEPTHAGVTKWPLTGGVPSQLSFTQDKGIERVYIAGYQDGSVRMWDTTHPVFSLICLLEGEVEGIKVAGSSSLVTKLDFCIVTLKLAVGSECGLVRIYDLSDSSQDSKFHFVTENKHEVHILPQGRGPKCKAAFSLLNSPVETLKFSNHGAKLAVGFGCGRVAVLHMNLLSVQFLTDHVSGPQHPVISIIWNELMNSHNLIESARSSIPETPDFPAEEVIFVLTKDAKVNIIYGGTGNLIISQPKQLKKESIAISIYVIEGSTIVSGISSEKDSQQSSEHIADENESIQVSKMIGTKSDEMQHDTSSGTADLGERLSDLLLLLCCNDALRLYSAKSVIQGNKKAMRKVKLEKPCCWTTTFWKNEKLCGLVLLFQTGVLEVRSFPDLELVRESSLMSILRWNFKANMDKTISSSDNGQIALANGCELAFISVLAGDNDFRIPESLPCLHDKVLAAATDAAISSSTNQKRKQNTAPKILGGIVKGFKVGKGFRSLDHSATSSSNNTGLEGMFSRFPFSNPSPTVADQEYAELNIDDIDIDEPVSTSHKVKNEKEKGTERDKLFEGASADMEPRLRTREEIIAKYRKAGDTSSVAAQAKNKLVERQEKLERINQRTEELQSGAEDFASLANELVKTLERRKWWEI